MLITPYLKPCPFCGGNAHIDEFINAAGKKVNCVICGNGKEETQCGALVVGFGVMDAVDQWNRRVVDDRKSII